ncbi:glycerol kinase GlpK [Hyphomonas sp. WL0036]|uniref:glycerol kinase GlpK n=1 Tax=Hyphomonas sediminis TaxID=2866160 RepID=UPI001C811C51|nr:glycerol kinase GlpK [Hyphomonas sediminis]MBY9067328.1 glycerol kinase GlpK [Hyphomonas sediminis]
MSDFILVIDEGTTSTRAIIYDRGFGEVAIAQEEVALQFPHDGWVEQDGEEIWRRTLSVCRTAIAKAGGAGRIAAIGITNQRETTLVWDRKTGKPLAPAIIWQDRRTAAVCEGLKGKGYEGDVQAETGLLLDPYFSGTKIGWVLSNVKGARERAEAGELAFGTVDCFLLWRLTGGRVHATDVTNASRTLLYRLGLGAEGGWSEAMAAMIGVPVSMLPEVKPSAADFGEADASLFGRAIPVCSILGDQQSALVGQGCLKPGQAKITYGTGAFLVANTGAKRPASENRLLGTVGYELPGGGALALEGSIFNAGTVIKWLRDDLKLIQKADESAAAAASLPDNGGVYMVPAFTGLGAPHWDAEARGVIAGLTRATSAAHLVRAGLESVAYQTHDLLAAFAGDGAPIAELRVDGGMVANDWLMQFLADVCALPVLRPDYREMTALGAAAAAAMQIGWVSPEDWAARDVPGKRFEPKMEAGARAALLKGWQAALGRTLS